MILHVRSKFTAVGRKEILTFFYLYLGLTVVSLLLDAGVLEARSGGAFPWFVAVQNGLVSALCTCLLVNGFVGFQLYEDGTNLSVWLLRLSSLGMFVISFAVSLLTFKSWAGLGPTNTAGLFIVVYLVNAIALAVYFVLQVILVVNTLQDRWPLAHLAFGVFFFVTGQVILYALSTRICEAISHYVDGMFFATVCNLLAVMMIYKYWDSITKEDLEFSVGTRPGNWVVGGQQGDIKDPLMGGYTESVIDDSRRGSAFDLGNIGTARNSMYDLTAAATPAGTATRPLDRDSLLLLHQQQAESRPDPSSRPGSSSGPGGHARTSSHNPLLAYKQHRSESHSRTRSAGTASASVNVNSGPAAASDTATGSSVIPARYQRAHHSRNQRRNRSQDRGGTSGSGGGGGVIPGALLLEGLTDNTQNEQIFGLAAIPPQRRSRYNHAPFDSVADTPTVNEPVMTGAGRTGGGASRSSDKPPGPVVENKENVSDTFTATAASRDLEMRREMRREARRNNRRQSRFGEGY